MKQLTCELCGGTDLVKQDGVFVCQNCGTKYAVEEAKKMMIEGTVDVQGTVKIDASDKVKNLYIMARRAKDDNNAELASKYYEMITFENPHDWESLFYFNYFKAMQTNLRNMANSAIRLANSLDSVFDLIDKSNIIADEKWNIAKEIIQRIDTLCESYIYWAKSHYRKFSELNGSASEFDNQARAIADLQKKMADLLEKYFAENSTQVVVSYLKSYVENYLLVKLFFNITLKYYSNELIAAEKRIKALDPSYVPLINANTQRNSASNKNSKESKNYQKENEVSKENNTSETTNFNKNKKSKKKIGIICLSAITVVIVLIVAINSFGNKITSDLVGTWRAERDSSISITFKNNGDMIARFSNAVDDGLSYKIDGDTVIVTFANNDTETYGFAVEGDTLIFGEYYYTKLK